jgi:ankyrin repeat protein
METIGPVSVLAFSKHSSPVSQIQLLGSSSAVRFLIEQGVISTESYPAELGDCTSLHIASAMGFTSVVKALINRSANLEAPDKQRRTPLHYAVTMQGNDWPEQERTVL